jgi:hypothetical protein
MKPEPADNEQIIGLIKSLSPAWREKQFDRLAPTLAEAAVFQDAEGHRLGIRQIRVSAAPQVWRGAA